MKPAKILFFIEGPAPSPEDFAAATSLAAQVVFRNALAVPNEAHALEICDGVAGAVPKIYAERFPDAEAAIETKKEELKKLSEKVGDKPAPKPRGQQAQKDDEKKDAPAGQTGGQAAPAWNPNPN